MVRGAVVEAKQARFPVGHGMQQALAYDEMLDAPFAISSNGDVFLLHDRTGLTTPVERKIRVGAFPIDEDLWALFRQWKGLNDPQTVELVEQHVAILRNIDGHVVPLAQRANWAALR